MTPLLISMKPRYANMLFMGVKTVELRRRFTTGLKGREAFVYVSSPVRRLWGGLRVDEVWNGTPEGLWLRVAAKAGVGRAEYDAYYSGSSVACALRVSRVWEHDAPVSLAAIRRELPEFRPPQSWRHAKGSELRWLEAFKRQAQHVPGGCAAGLLPAPEGRPGHGPPARPAAEDVRALHP